jgi:phage shock protein PspC (stress-responsive transcriptional regulator)
VDHFVNQASMTDEQAQPGERGQAPGRLRPAASNFGLHLALAICVFAGLLLFYGYSYPLHHDLAGSVLSGRLAVALGESYRDYSIYFPPAERVWYSIAARLSDLTGLRLDLAVVAMTGAMVLISAELAYRIRRATVGASPLFLVLSVALLVILPILFKNVFGMREHLVALGLWPYLVLRVSDPDGTRIGWRTRLILGLWMGATLLIKYLYSIVVFLVELADALIQRRPFLLLRIENIVAGAVVALYLLCWLILDPSQRTAVGAMFSAIDANLADPATNWSRVAENLGYAAAFLVFLHGFRVPGRLMSLGLATLTGAVVVAWSQERWYTHHLFPIIAAYVVWWWMAKRHFLWWGHVALALCLSYPLIREFRSTLQYREQVAEVDRAISEAGRSVNGKRVGILTMHPSPYNQYLASHGAVRWNTLMNNAYVAAELKPFDTKENAGKLPPPVKLDDPGRQMLHDQMLRLWEDMPPDVMILDHTYRWPLRYIDVDWQHEFSKDPRFSAILKRYRPVFTHRGKRTRFTYYVRAD